MRILFIPFGLVLVACGDGGSASGGDPCSTDDQCKGDRICEQGVCVDPSQGGVGGDAAGGASGDGGGDVSTPGGPQFLSFGSDVSGLDKVDYRDNPTVSFTAVLTDPDGVDDVIGGSLLDESGSPYGAFATSGQEGAYEMTLSWDQLNQVAPIDFDAGATGARSFRAQFFDVDGHLAEKTISITLGCDDRSACDGDCGVVRCGGECVGLGSDENCTACGDDCGSGQCVDDGYLCSWDHPDCACSTSSTEDDDDACSDGIDNDGDGYTDCIDYDCSLNPQVTVCDA